MALLTSIDGVPVYSTVAEALSYAAANNLVGYHTHTVLNGQTGYMGGATHAQAATPSSGFQQNNENNQGLAPYQMQQNTTSGGGGTGY